MMSNEEEKRCPLCAEEMDWTDQQFKPCKCGYQVCVWCWHHIMDMAEKAQTEGLCPACRTIYEKDKIAAMRANCQRVFTKNSVRKSRQPKVKQKPDEVKKDLRNVRVVQRKMAYVIGLPLRLADEDLLQRKEYFGQYGKIIKVSLSRTAGGAIQQFANDSCSVYITYSKEEETIRCIRSVHGYVLEGRYLRASFGTAKYCHAWLKNMPCNNRACLYLHNIGPEEDSFGKDEVSAVHTRNKVQEVVGHINNPARRSGNVLPHPTEELSCSDSVSLEKTDVISAFMEGSQGNGVVSSSYKTSIQPSKDKIGSVEAANKITTFVDIVGRSNPSFLDKDKNISGDRIISSISHVAPGASISKEYRTHEVSSQPMRMKGFSPYQPPKAHNPRAFPNNISKEDHLSCFDGQGPKLDANGFSQMAPFLLSNKVHNSTPSLFSSEEIVKQLRRIGGDSSSHEADGTNFGLDPVESSIISNIMSIELDSHDDSLPNSLNSLSGGRNSEHGSIRSIWNNSTHNDGSSFLRHDGLAKQLGDSNSSFITTSQVASNKFGDSKNNHWQKPHYQVSRLHGVPAPGFSREQPPPGFSVNNGVSRFGRFAFGNQLPHSSFIQAGPNTSLLKSAHVDIERSSAETAGGGYNGSSKTLMINGLSSSYLDVSSSCTHQPLRSGFEDEARAWLHESKCSISSSHQAASMQNQSTNDKLMNYVGDGSYYSIEEGHDFHGFFPKVHDDSQSYDQFSSFKLQIEQQKLHNSYLLNGYYYSNSSNNNIHIEQHDKLGQPSKYYSRHEDFSTFQTSNSSGDLYTNLYRL